MLNRNEVITVTIDRVNDDYDEREFAGVYRNFLTVVKKFGLDGLPQTPMGPNDESGRVCGYAYVDTTFRCTYLVEVYPVQGDEPEDEQSLYEEVKQVRDRLKQTMEMNLYWIDRIEEADSNDPDIGKSEMSRRKLMDLQRAKYLTRRSAVRQLDEVLEKFSQESD